MTSFTIGQVLNLLRDEFEDITIGRIRQLETQGLITPDRTDAGYRKFTERDVERLRYIFAARRDRDVSIEVIRRELDGAASPAGAPAPTEAADPVATRPSQAPTTAETGVLQLPFDGVDADTESSGSSGEDPSWSHRAPSDDAPEQPGHDSHAAHSDNDRAREATGRSAPSEDDPFSRGPFVDELGDLRLTDSEFADAAGLTTEDVQQLREHGLLGSEALFVPAQVAYGRVLAQLLHRGLEPRHLRMYRQFAQRESMLFEQLVGSLLRQRNPDSRQRAQAGLQELSELVSALQQQVRERELDRLLREWR